MSVTTPPRAMIWPWRSNIGNLCTMLVCSFPSPWRATSSNSMPVAGRQRLGVVRRELRRELGREDLGIGAENDVEAIDAESAR